MEDKMGVHLGHCLEFLTYVVSEHYVLQSEVKGRADWEMTENKTVWLATMLMEEDEICYSFS